MATSSQTWTEELIEVGNTRLKVVTGGSGKPLLILHGELGYSGWLKYHETLAQNYKLHIPLLPGFGVTPRIDWVMNIRDLASWYLGVLDELEEKDLNVVGFSLGGWLAAEMASMCPHHFRSLTLVGAMGIKPPTGEIFDMFLVVAKDYLAKGILTPQEVEEFELICPEEVSPEQLESWALAREESSRLGWKPYMHDLSLPNLLNRLKELPTLLVWGKEDQIVPPSAAEIFSDSIDKSQVVLLDNCGHQPEIEHPDKFAQIVDDFVSKSHL